MRIGWILATLATSGCGLASRGLLFANTPSFDVDVEVQEDGSTRLSAWGYDPEWLEDDLCDEDDGESCKNDYFVGFAFYRSDAGPYSADYVELGVVWESEFVDIEAAGDGTAWRAAILREEDDDDVRIDKVSIAAMIEEVP